MTSSNRSTSTRDRINAHVHDHPGIHFNELVRDLDVATGQVQYHIRRLIRSHDITKASLYGRTHYYPPSFSTWEQGVLALARRETSREILFYLLENDASRPSTLAQDLDIARSTLEWHLDRLIEQDIIEKTHLDNGTVSIAIVDAQRLVQLLSTVTPRVHDQLSDRFMRFVDSLFEAP